LTDFQQVSLFWSVVAFVFAWLFLNDDGEDDDEGGGGMLQPVYQGSGF